MHHDYDEDQRTEPLRQARDDFEAALGDLASTARREVRGVVEDVTHGVEQSFHVLTEEALKGLKEIKRELDVTVLAQSHPWRWVGGAAAAGTLMAFTIARPTQMAQLAGAACSFAMKTTKKPASGPVARRSYVNLVLDVGLALIQAKMLNGQTARAARPVL